MSSVSKKMVMAVTGFALFLFIIGHMLGNLQVFLGSEALNAYAHKLQSMGAFLWTARVFLLVILIVHMALAISVSIENRKARPIPYCVKNSIQTTYAGRTMMLSGALIFLFIVYHLAHFTLGVIKPEAFHLVDSQGRHDVYAMMIAGYKSYLISSIYILAMMFLCWHLSHGFASFLQTLGLTKTDACIGKAKLTGRILAAIIFIGNTAMPMAVLLGILR